MNAVPLIICALAIFALAYRYYFGFIAAKVLAFDDNAKMPSQSHFDGQNFVPTSKWVLFGHHFAAIAGAGPLVGPVLAAQFGYFPGFVWMILGAVLAGSVHDVVILTASVRYQGKSLAEIARKEIDAISGNISTIAILIILVIALAGLGLVVVNALAESVWGTFTIAATIPIALLMGVWMYKIRKGKTLEATIGGVILLSLAVIFGKFIPGSSIAGWFKFDHKTLTILIAIYAFFASVLPVWLLLSPRDYLSSIMKVGVILLLAVGIIVVAPNLQMPAFTKFTHGGGPIIPGTLFPYLFITIACGAISGFHALVSSGTTPKMIMSEKHIRPIAVGSMLTEGTVSILALIAACSLMPLDYFLINIPAEKFNHFLPVLKEMGFVTSEIASLSQAVDEQIVGRTGGAVSLAVGMAKIFSAIPGMKHLMSYWYHFAIMFEALFILTTLDAGTRIARFVLQDGMGKIYKPFGRADWLPGNLIASGLIVIMWSYFIYTGSIGTIWPMFGTANQLLASIALIIGTSFLINHGKKKFAIITIAPLIFISITTVYAGILNLINLYIPQMFMDGKQTSGIINTMLTLVILACYGVILSRALPKWFKSKENLINS